MIQRIKILYFGSLDIFFLLQIKTSQIPVNRYQVAFYSKNAKTEVSTAVKEYIKIKNIKMQHHLFL